MDRTTVSPWPSRRAPPPPGREPRLARPRGGPRYLGLPLPVCAPVLAGNERRYVEECLRSGWISSAGPMVERFERAFARRLGVADAVACSSGTAALHLALREAGVGPGDEVLVPAFTMIAVCNAVLQLGARPVLVDVEPDTWNIDPRGAARRMGPRTRAIVATHTYGHPARLDELARLARRRGAALVEDAAEALGASWLGRPAGRWGRVASFSLYANKVITSGEGGLVAVSSRAAGERLRVLRDHGFSRDRHFWHRVAGYNYRMTSLQAAVGLAQLERLDGLLEARRRNARLYRRLLAGLPGVLLPPRAAGAEPSDWVFGVVLEPAAGVRRDAARAALARDGVETRSFFAPMHQQPAHRALFRGERHPVAEALGARGLYLPSSSGLTGRQVAYAAERLRCAVGAASR